MDKQKFLLKLLAGIFVFQACLFGAGFYYCANNGGLDPCPKIGERYEQTFNTMLATVLALMTGATLTNQR
jgi:hypothetical protein